jgi:hypothetical protein
MTTSYRVQTEISSDDGAIWQAVDGSEILEADSPAEFRADENGVLDTADPGTLVRVLVWPADYDGWGTEYGAVHVDTCTVPDPGQ